MTRMHVITYVTHSQGMYEYLKSDAANFDIPLTVLGWGEKWVGYFQKLKQVLKHVDTLDPGDGVIVIDGFDTRINGCLEDFKRIWLDTYQGKVVFSVDNKHGRVPKFIEEYFNSKVFGGDANAGLYVGKASHIVDLLDRARDFEGVCRGDDQCAFNKISRFITLDQQQLLFRNAVGLGRTIRNSGNAIFVSFPGQFTWERQLRFISNAYPFFVQEILAIIVAILLLYIPFSSKHSRTTTIKHVQTVNTMQGRFSV